MSNRVSRGTARAGGLHLDKPGIKFSPAIRFKSSGSTVEVVTAYKFPENAVVDNVYVRTLSVSATSATISIGLASASSSTLYNGFINAMPLGSTSFPNLVPNTNAGATSYFGCLLGSTGTQTKVNFAVGSCSTGGGAAGTATMRYLSVSVGTTEAVTVTVTPIYFELE